MNVWPYRSIAAHISKDYSPPESDDDMDRELFDEVAVAIGLGGRLDVSKLRPETADFLQVFQSYAEQYIRNVKLTWSNVPDIQFHFINTRSIQALAFQHKGRHFVGVSLGAVIGLTLLFERMLRDRRILPEMGDASQEADYPPVGEPLLELLMDDNIAHGQMPPPRDKCRHALATVFSERAFIFLLLHELAHIALGHVDYLKSKAESRCLVELGYTPLTEDESLELQVFESQADCTAASMCADLAWRFFDQKIGPANAMPALQTHEQQLFGWLFSLFVFMRVFGDEPIAGRNLYTSSHPPFRFRLKNVWLSMQRLTEQKCGLSFQQFVPLFWRAAFATEQAFHFLTGQGAARERYLEATGPELDEYYRRTRTCWNGGLRDRLAKYTYAPLMDSPV